MQFKIAEGEGLQLVSKVLEKEALCYDDLNQFNGEIVEVYDEIGDLNGFYGLEICHEDVILRSVVILQSFRKKGLGHKIVDHAIQNATRKNLKTMYLLTTTAENFFAKIGFEVTDRSQVPSSVAATNEFENFCPSTAVCMKLSLT